MPGNVANTLTSQCLKGLAESSLRTEADRIRQRIPNIDNFNYVLSRFHFQMNCRRNRFGFIAALGLPRESFWMFNRTDAYAYFCSKSFTAIIARRQFR